jgi:hypothetical protein
MADVQDGKRFELDQRFDLVVNPSSVLSVSVTGSDASGARPGWCASPVWAWTTGAPASTPTAAARPRPAGGGPARSR